MRRGMCSLQYKSGQQDLSRGRALAAHERSLQLSYRQLLSEEGVWGSENDGQ
jgi:hypothetical protein